MERALEEGPIGIGHGVVPTEHEVVPLVNP